MLGGCMVKSDLMRGLNRPHKMTLRVLASGDNLLLEMLSCLEVLGAGGPKCNITMLMLHMCLEHKNEDGITSGIRP